MARRRSRPSLPLTSWLLLLLPVAGAAYFGWRALRGPDTPFPGVAELRTADYFENANSLRGNTYQVTGVVEDNLRWSAEKGRLVSILVKNADGTAGDPLPISVPPSVTDNLQAGQTVVFRLRVGTGGLLIAEAMARQ